MPVSKQNRGHRQTLVQTLVAHGQVKRQQQNNMDVKGYLHDL